MDVNKLAAVFVFEMYAQQSTESGQHFQQLLWVGGGSKKKNPSFSHASIFPPFMFSTPTPFCVISVQHVPQVPLSYMIITPCTEIRAQINILGRAIFFDFVILFNSSRALTRSQTRPSGAKMVQESARMLFLLQYKSGFKRHVLNI